MLILCFYCYSTFLCAKYIYFMDYYAFKSYLPHENQPQPPLASSQQKKPKIKITANLSGIPSYIQIPNTKLYKESANKSDGKHSLTTVEIGTLSGLIMQSQASFYRKWNPSKRSTTSRE